MSNLITYTYDFSPYGYKLHSVIALLGIKDYRNVQVGVILPRPELTAIGVNYRRIPVAAFGRDVYCDTQSIIARLLSESSNASQIYGGNAASVLAHKMLGDAIFRTSLPAIPSAALTPDFVKDRAGVFPSLGDPDLLAGKLKGQALSELRSILLQLEDELSSGSQFLAGDKPTLLDAHLAWAVRFLKAIGLLEEKFLSKNDLPAVHKWLDAFESAASFNLNNIDGDAAAKEILGAQVKDSATNGSSSAENDHSGFSIGEQVAVNQSDADPTHPTEGKLVALTAHEVVVEVKSGVRVHLPRLGQKITKA